MTKKFLYTTCALTVSAVGSASAANYFNDFNAYADGTTNLGDGTTVASNLDQAGFPVGQASVQGGELRITEDDVNSQRASFRIPALPNSSLGWTATFGFTIFDAAGGNAPADGFSFNYGSIPAYDPGLATGIAGLTGHGFAEEGWGPTQHISFEADTWNDPPGEGGFNIAGNIGGSQQDFGHVPTVFLTDGGSLTGTATLSWDPANGASFSTDLTGALFTNVATGAFTGDDSYSFAFGARTGGANEEFRIDDLSITTVPEPSAFLLTGLAGLGMMLRRRR